MSKWDMVRLGDVCEFINGDRGVNYPSSNDFIEKGIPFINAGHLKNDSISFDNMNYIPEQKYNQLGSGKVRNGDFLYCLRGSLGKQAIVNNMSKGAIASSLVILRPKSINIGFLGYCMKTNIVFEQLVKTNNGSSQPNLSASSVKNFIIPLPPLPVQQKIAEVLDRASALIVKRKAQIAKLDLLVKSQFIKKFGDPHEMGKWTCKHIEDVASVTVGVVIKPAQYYTEEPDGIRTFRSLNVGEMHVRDDDWVYFTPRGHKSNNKSELKEGDVLVVRSGYPGTSCVVPANYEGCNAIDIIIARPNKAVVNPVYMCAFTNAAHGMNQIKTKTGGAAQQHFNVGAYKNLTIALPPLPLQKRFADFVRAADKLRFEMRQGLNKLELMYKSLMQKCFSG